MTRPLFTRLPNHLRTVGRQDPVTKGLLPERNETLDIEVGLLRLRRLFCLILDQRFIDSRTALLPQANALAGRRSL